MRLAWLYRRDASLLSLLLVAVTVAFYGAVALRNPHVGFLADDALYLLMADIYSPYREAFGAVYDHVRLYSHLPPFFPLVLALFGAGSDHLQAARATSAGIMASAWIFFYIWQRRVGLPRSHAVLLSIFCAWTPGTLLYTIDLWSEGLYIALVMLSLICVQPVGGKPANRMLLLTLGLLLACVVETRSIGIALAPALFVALLRRSLKAAVAMAVFAGLFLILLRPLHLGAAGQSYLDSISLAYGADPVGALQRQLKAVATAAPLEALYDLFQLRVLSAWQRAAALGLFFASVIGLLRELRHCSPAAIYVVAYLVIALTWPFPELLDRFLYPLLPFAVFLAWRGAAWGSRSQPGGLVVAALLFALALPAWVGMMKRSVTPVPHAALDSFRMTRYWLDTSRGGDVVGAMQTLDAYERAASSLAATVPPAACIYTVQVHLTLLRAKRPAFLPPPPAAMKRGPPWGCRYFLLAAEALPGRPAFYPLEYLREHARVLSVSPQPAPGRPAKVAARTILMRVD